MGRGAADALSVSSLLRGGDYDLIADKTLS